MCWKSNMSQLEFANNLDELRDEFNVTGRPRSAREVMPGNPGSEHGAGQAVEHILVDGIRLEYACCAGMDEARPPLVLLHEGLGCVSLWKSFPQQLAQATGRFVHVLSRQGYGGSDPKPTPWELSYMHREGLEILPRALAVLGLQRPVLLGHSDGASIALIYAGGVADCNASALILLAPHVFNEPVSVASIAKARTAYLETDLRRRLGRHHGDNVDNAFWGWNDAWLAPGFRDWNIECFLQEIDIPVLLLQGEDDQYGSREQLYAIQRQVRSQAEVHFLPGCRHAPFLDQPSLTLTTIQAFLHDLNHG